MSVHKLDMLTRVEGHGSVELIREGERVVGAHLSMHESPRLFEALFVGRRFDEVADIACRICSICSTVHKVAALQAVEQALSVSVSRQTGLLRELAVQAGQIESHALHIFCLALPDYLGVNSVQELAACAPEQLKTGLKIKKIGNLIQEVVGGRAIHPFNLRLGGLGKVPDANQLQQLGEQLLALDGDISASLSYLTGLKDILPPLAALQFCAVSGGPPLFGNCLETSLPETIPANDAAGWLNEQVEENTYAKVSKFNGSLPFMVGPLARQKLATHDIYSPQCEDAAIGSSLKARAVELGQAVNRSLWLINRLLADGVHKEIPATVMPTAGSGSALIEAPRGTLLHRYDFDEAGLCLSADIITPTAINQGAIAASLENLIAAMDGSRYEQIRRSSEILVRCFDPCISCAVH